MNLPLFITSASRELMLSCDFFCTAQQGPVRPQQIDYALETFLPSAYQRLSSKDLSCQATAAIRVQTLCKMAASGADPAGCATLYNLLNIKSQQHGATGLLHVTGYVGQGSARLLLSAELQAAATCCCSNCSAASCSALLFLQLRTTSGCSAVYAGYSDTRYTGLLSVCLAELPNHPWQNLPSSLTRP